MRFMLCNLNCNEDSTVSSLRFPYDLPSERALVELIRRDRPQDDVREGFVRFGDFYYSPTATEPGRTYVEMNNLRTGKKRWFVYRRLSIDQVLREYAVDDQYYVTLEIDGAITSAKILAELNRTFRLPLDHTDVDTDDQIITTNDATVFTLTMRPDSYAYYGQAVIYVNTTPDKLYARLLEDGSIRLLENGVPRLMEG